VTGALSSLLHDLQRAVRWHRRLLAAGLAAAAVALTIHAAAPAPPPTVPVVVASRDLPGGAAVTSRDITGRRVSAASRPAHALSVPATAVGRVLTSPVRSGEALTDVRLVGPSLFGMLPAGLVAAPVRVADAAATRLLRAGDLVDVVAAAGSATAINSRATAAVVAPASRVLVAAGPAAESTAATVAGEGALIVLAVDQPTALALARSALDARLSLLLRPG